MRQPTEILFSLHDEAVSVLSRAQAAYQSIFNTTTNDEPLSGGTSPCYHQQQPASQSAAATQGNTLHGWWLVDDCGWLVGFSESCCRDCLGGINSPATELGLFSSESPVTAKHLSTPVVCPLNIYLIRSINCPDCQWSCDTCYFLSLIFAGRNSPAPIGISYSKAQQTQ